MITERSEDKIEEETLQAISEMALGFLESTQEVQPESVTCNQETYELEAYINNKNQSKSENVLYQTSYDGLLPLIKRLDCRIAAAIHAADKMFAARAAGDLNRGLTITPADVAAALGRIPGETMLSISAQIPALTSFTQSLSLQRLIWLKRVFALTDADIDIILVGLAPEIDLRYEQLYAYLHDQVTKRRPSVDLALNLLCPTAADKLQQRQRFAPDAPLLKQRLIEVYADLHNPNTSLLGRYFRIDEQIVRFLLLDDSMDSRLAEFCQMVEIIPVEKTPPLNPEMQALLVGYAKNCPQTGLKLYFQGPSECGQTEAGALLANSLEVRLLKADLKSISVNTETAQLFPILVREAWFRSALLHIQATEFPTDSSNSENLASLWQALKTMPTDCVIQGQAAWIPAPNKPLGVVTVSFDFPATMQRKDWWQLCLRQYELSLSGEATAQLAQRYRMTYAQIQNAAAQASVIAKASAAKHTDQPNDADEKSISEIIFTAARAQTGHELAKLATKIEPRANWEDLILPEDQIQQLHEICNRYNYRDKVLNEWGFAKKLSYGLGITVLFSGGSGTGKTMAADVIANALGLDLYRIDLSQVVNKYIGETEKNLDRVFSAAANSNAILFFDEADALFGKRTEVKDAHDRYANLETSYLLQKMEQHEGIAILATNLCDNLDQAFTRRLAFSLHFPFPDEVHRLLLWQRAWPTDTPFADEIDLELLARELQLSGGNIKNIGLASSFLAASYGQAVNSEHLIHAVGREYEKLGRSLSANLIKLPAGVKHVPS
jgi:ATP-dependent 26S proteasome regulatory subunit